MASKFPLKYRSVYHGNQTSQTLIPMKSFISILLVLACMLVSASAVPDCDCNYHSGGCRIVEPPPAGWKCDCAYKGFWTCNGAAIQCGESEDCPADCYTVTCCNRGGGDCGAY
eukprot:TRINITY_DN45905_c0_g1_i1.p1 TRINITY_DN45905_c0_g1~~TRINITY_DN45905_c0_g1_i1.p1  ORF type:complete len:113 (-),score=21.14 TRINITY_DN45905_c0_g1_i1:100-438(-)